MKFIAYFELSESITPLDMLKGAELLSKAAITFEGTKVTNWMVTPENWGIAMIESKSEEHLLHLFSQWRIAVPGVYKVVKCAPAMTVEEYTPKLLDLANKMKKPAK
nr:hypothetical protein [Candidatus Sigynarchaeota archaeon]